MYSEVAFVDEYRIALFAVEITFHHSCVPHSPKRISSSEAPNSPDFFKMFVEQ